MIIITVNVGLTKAYTRHKHEYNTNRFRYEARRCKVRTCCAYICLVWFILVRIGAEMNCLSRNRVLNSLLPASEA